MTRILIVHGLGMDQRGKTQIEIFGPMTLAEYDQHIQSYAKDLGLEIEIFQTNDEAALIAKLKGAKAGGAEAVVFNPSAFGVNHPAIPPVVAELGVPVIEVHITNPLRRTSVSDTAKVSTGMVTGFGVFGYGLALRGLKDLLARTAA